MSSIFKTIGYFLLIISGIFTVFQIYLDRKSASIETIGTAWQLSDPKTSNESAIKWALAELAPCYELTRLQYAPSALLADKYWLNEEAINVYLKERYRESDWDQCRSESFSFSGIKMSSNWLKTFTTCPDSLGDDFSSLFTPKLSFRDTNFICVSFSKSQMENLNSNRSMYVGSGFVDANLKGSVWKKSDLRHVNFRGAHLKGALFESSNLKGANFIDAKLSKSKFDNVMITGKESFRGADLTGADMSGLDNMSFDQLKEICYRAGETPPILPSYLSGQAGVVQECSG